MLSLFRVERGDPNVVLRPERISLKWVLGLPQVSSQWDTLGKLPEGGNQIVIPEQTSLTL